MRTWPGQHALIGVLALLLLLAITGPLLFANTDTPGLSQFLWQRQDWPVLLILLGGLLLVRRGISSGPAFAPRVSPMIIGCAALLLFAAAWSGHGWLMAGYDLTRDEQMVLFDADILARADLFARLSADWAMTGQALNRVFTLPMATSDAWVSAYLPGNAALHTMFASLGDAHATAPALAAIAAVALWWCARQLWPGDAAPQTIALLCLLLSAQFLVTATTTYAMTAHLALNLLWLALFLRGRWWSFALLLPVGFIATGLHQPVFHPLFVAPFLWLLVERRQWPALALLVVGYAVIGLFWLSWPGIVDNAAGPAIMATGGSGGDYLTRLVETLAGWEPYGLWLMAFNLLRFAAWQHLLLLPLVFAAVITGARSNGMIRALALGPLLTIAALLILLPYQGHGWGYRYLHGLIGNLCLLAGFGWIALRQKGWDRRRLIGWSSAATLLAIVWLGWNAHRMVAPYALADRMIAASPSDLVLIDDRAAPFAQDLVYNPPWLDRRPIRLAASGVEPAAAWSRLCAGRSLAIVGPAHLAPIGAYFDQPVAAPSRSLRDAQRILAAAGCQGSTP